LDACKIAEIPIERLINETSAIAISYGLFRKKELEPEVARNVVFIDFGHSKTSAFVGSFFQVRIFSL
jgi:heat shock protein 4